MAIRSDNYWQASADRITAVTKSDTVNMPEPSKALYVLTTGNLSVVTSGGGTAILPVTAGQVLTLQVSRVNATNSTATCVSLN